VAKLSILKGATSVLVRIFVMDSASTVGAGKTGLTAASFTGTKCYVARDDDGNAAGTAVTLADSTRGTWSSGGIKEKDATNMPGVYELGLTNASLATGSRSCTYFLGGTGLVPTLVEIELVTVDNQVDIAQTGDIFNVVKSGGAGDAAAIKAQTDKLAFTVANQVDCNPLSWRSGAIPAVNVTGVPLVDDKYLLGTIYGTPATAYTIATAVWQDLTSIADFTTPGSIGALLVADIDAKISSRATSGDTPGTNSRSSAIRFVTPCRIR